MKQIADEMTTEPRKGPSRRGLFGAGLFLTVSGLSGCTPSQTQRLKLTVTVNDNGVLRTGSSVMQSTCWQTNNKLGGMGIGGCHITGEAVLVDLKQRGYLFMLQCGRKSYLVEGGMAGVMESKPEWDSKSWTVERGNIPLMVGFVDVGNSKSVVEIDPENLATIYGDGVTLKSVDAKYTDEPVTHGQIERALPWLANIGPNNLEGRLSTNSTRLSGRLTKQHFLGYK